MAALAVKAGTDFPLEALEQILQQRLKLALVRQCVQLHAVVARVAPATPEMQQQIQMAVQAALLQLPLTAVNILPLYIF